MENKVTTTKSANTSIESEIIKNCSTNELNTVLAYLYTLCGFEKMPNETQDMVLISFIRDHFNYLTIQDMKRAFELGISGETGVNMKHYHNFNAIYFSEVINAYRTYLKQQKQAFPKQIETPSMSEQQKKENHIKWINSVCEKIEQFNKGEISEFPDYGNTLYNYLDKKVINFTNERKLQIKEKAREELLKEFRADKIDKPGERNRIGIVITDILTDGKDTEGLVKTRAKKLALQIFLTECKEMERGLVAEIKEHEKL